MDGQWNAARPRGFQRRRPVLAGAGLVALALAVAVDQAAGRAADAGSTDAGPATRPLVVPDPTTLTARWALAAGPQAIWSGGGVGTLLAGAAVLTWRPFPRYEFSARTILPVAGAVTVPQGSAQVIPRFFGLGMARRWVWRDGALRATFGPDAGLLWNHVDASGTTTTAGAFSADHLTGAFIERGTLSARLAQHVALTFEAASGFAFTRTSLRIGDRTVATWGRPLLTAGLRLEVAWP